MKDKNFYIGIDLGTTNSVISFGHINPRTGKLEAKVFSFKGIASDGKSVKTFEILPSYVFFKDNDSPIVGEYAKGMLSLQASKVVKSIKSKMGEPDVYVYNEKKYFPEDISSLILKFLANKAKEMLNFFPEDVVITVPASFNTDQREATLRAAEKAGFKIYDKNGKKRNILLDEPRAALFDFIETCNRNEIPDITLDFKSPKNILVYDLGGGTLDVSLHKVSYDECNEKLNIQDLAISRYTQIGGDNFDKLVANYFKKKLEQKGVKISLLNDYENNLLDGKLIELAETIKLELNTDIYNKMEFSLLSKDEINEIEIEILRANIWDDKGISEEMSLKKYKTIVKDLLGENLKFDDYKNIDKLDFLKNNNIIFPILDVLYKASKKTKSEVKIDAVLLNGGMTKFYLIKERISDFFGFKPLSLGDEDKSVAKGAVYYHNSLHRGITYNKIQNESIGIELDGGYVKHLVPAGTILPYSEEIKGKFQIKEDNATSIILPFYLGERQDTSLPNKKIAKRVVKFPKPLKKGTIIDIKLEIDEEGILLLKGGIENSNNYSFDINIEADQIEEENSPNLINIKKYQTIKEPKIKRSIKTGELIVKEEEEKKLDNLFREKSFPSLEYKIILNKLKTASNGFVLGEYLLNKIDFVSKENKSKIILLLKEIGNDNDVLKEKIINKLVKLTSEKSLITYETKDMNRIVKDSIRVLSFFKEEYLESHLLYLLTSPYTVTITDTIINALGKIGYSKNCFIYLVQELEKCQSDEIGKMINLIWSISKIGKREKINSIPSIVLISAIEKIKQILTQNNHKELSEKCILALGELGDARFGNEISEDESKNLITFLNNISMTRGKFLQKNIEIVKKMILGNILTIEEEENLLTIRKETRE